MRSRDTYVMPDFRFLIDFHWAISCLDGGWSSCRDDDSRANEEDAGSSRSALLLATDRNVDIGSSCMQNASSASSESTAADASSSPPSAVGGGCCESSPTPFDLLPLDARSSDKTNRLEFLRCSMTFAVTVRGCRPCAFDCATGVYCLRGASIRRVWRALQKTGGRRTRTRDSRCDYDTAMTTTIIIRVPERENERILINTRNKSRRCAMYDIMLLSFRRCRCCYCCIRHRHRPRHGCCFGGGR